MTIQIVGALTDGGTKKAGINKSRFEMAAYLLREKYPDAVVMNPIEQHYEGDDWEKCMFHTMDSMIVDEPIIYLINNWKKSKGARKEVLLAKKLGLEIWEEE